MRMRRRGRGEDGERRWQMKARREKGEEIGDGEEGRWDVRRGERGEGSVR